MKRVALFNSGNPFKRFHFAEIGSTQAWIKENINQLETSPGKRIVATAAQQTKGHGYKGRTWVSPPGNIYATFALITPDAKAAEVEWSPYMIRLASMAVVKTLEELGLAPKIKWENDVLVDNAKISGVLCERSMTTSGEHVVIIGIGLNVNMEQELCKSINQPTTSLYLVTGEKYNVDKILGKLSIHLDRYLNDWLAHGITESLATTMNGYMAFLGEVVRIREEDESTILQGLFTGIDAQGRLCLDLGENDVRHIGSGRLLREIGVDIDEDGRNLLSLGTQTNFVPQAM